MCIKGDDGDGSTSVSDYVEQLRADLIQQAVDERSSWLQSQFKPLLHRSSKDGKPAVVDIARFLELPIAKREGGIRNSDPQTQHHREVDWRSAGQQCSGIGSGDELCGCIIFC